MVFGLTRCVFSLNVVFMFGMSCAVMRLVRLVLSILCAAIRLCRKCG